MDLKPTTKKTIGKAVKDQLPGPAQKQREISRLSEALAKAGRSSELEAAKGNPTKLDKLLKEFGISGGAGGAF